MRKMILLLLALVGASVAWADSDVQSEVVDGVTWYYRTTSTYWDSALQKYVTYSYVTSGDDKYTGALVIPSSLGGYSVNRIAPGAFSGCSGLTSITIPEGVTSFGNSVFSGCSGLTSITIPEGVTSIGSSTFYGCSGLTSVTIPSGVTSIGNYAFSGCSGLTSVTIPDGVTSIGSCAFYGCSGLTSVTIPDGVTSIGDGAFKNCRSLIRFDVPASVTSLGECVVAYCASLKILTVADGNKNYKCINNCIVSAGGSTLIAVALGSDEVVIPDGVVEISSYMFYNDYSIKSVVVPGSVQSVGAHAFQNCTALSGATLSNGLLSIGESAFYGCGALLDIMIPGSVTMVGSYAFCNCNSLTNAIMCEGVKSIGGSAFSNCRSLVNVVIPESVESIGDAVFYNCSMLASAKLPSQIDAIEDRLFYSCRSLAEIIIPTGVVSIGSEAFRSCSGLTSIEIPSSVTSIGDYAFYGCSGLTSVTIPSSVTSIGERAFWGCTGLTDVTIPSSVTSIGSSAFSGCSGLTSVTIPSSVTSIGNYAFYCCSGLGDVTFFGAPPSGVAGSCLLSNSKCQFSYPREYGAAWMKLINDVNTFRGYNRVMPQVAVLSSAIRKDDPTILDVVYKVTSSQPTVKVRALAFEDGVRSFANVVRPETFIADTNGVATAGNVGDSVTANVEHTLSWKVSADWSNELAKVTFEVLATEGELLPLEVRTIPASDKYGKMDVTWNAITEDQWFDALLWLYADKTDGLTLVDGVLKDGTTVLAKGESLYKTEKYGCWNGHWYTKYFFEAPSYVLGKMGYTILSDEVLEYANDETRLGLSPDGVRQYGYKISEK